MLHFYKYQGTGNDFILLNNLNNTISLTTSQIKFLCDRRFGIGADGLMLIQQKQAYDFEMKYYNSDGRESSMCGNGGRCIVKFADFIGIKKRNYTFCAIDGKHEAKLFENGRVELKMKEINSIKKVLNGFFLDTGSPHFIIQKNDILNIDVVSNGRSIRNSPEFIKEGVNVNFVEFEKGHLFVRTYERGVEDETLSCGTGVTASAIVFSKNEPGPQEIKIKALGGELMVKFNRKSEQHFTDIWLCGPAEFVFEGKIQLPINQ